MTCKRSHLGIWGAAAIALGGCVTEPASPKRGVRVEPRRDVAMPEGPVATPAAGAAVSTARIRVEVLPLGSVAYDGQVLPLVSPDGRFLAVQAGDAPTWETLLARPGAAVPMRTALVVYDLTGAAAAAVSFAQPLPPGLILGRSADDRGFLVEGIRPEGSRWLGRVEWVSGRLEWLVQSDQVNAHAVLTPDGELLFTRADLRGGPADLVLRRRDGTEDVRAESDGSFLFPMASADRRAVYALVDSSLGLELLALSLVPDPGRTGATALGSTIARTRLVSTATPEMAYQVTAAVHPALPTRPGTGQPPQGHEPTQGLVLFVPAAGRMGRFDLMTGGFDFLPPGSVAAAISPYSSPPGYFAATADGLVFVPADSLGRRDGLGRETQAAEVLGDPFVPRATANPQRPFVLIGPMPRDPKRLRIVAMAIPS